MTTRMRSASMAAGAIFLLSVSSGCTEHLPAAQEQQSSDEAPIRVLLGAEEQTDVSPGTEVTLPLVVDMENAESLNLASLAFEIRWDPDRLTFVSSDAGDFGFVTINDGEVTNGRLIANLFAADGTTEGFEALSLVVESGADEGPASLEIDVTTAGDELGNDILANISTRGHEIVISN